MISNSIQGVLATNLYFVPTYPIKWIIDSMLDDYCYTNLQKIKILRRYGKKW